MPDEVNSFCKLFADDSKIYLPIHSPEDQATLQNDLLKLCSWSEKWFLQFSIPKCKVIQYGNVKHQCCYHTIDNSSHHFDVPNCSEEKDLGILFEVFLKFNKQVANTVFRCNRLIGLIKRSFQFMTKKLFITLYKSLIRSIIDYGCIVWLPSTKKNSQLIENIQRRATRLVPELKGLSYHQRLTELNLPTMLYRRKC